MKRFFIITVLLLLVLLSIPAIQYGILSYNFLWKYSAEFDAYKKEFILVKDYIAEEYPVVKDSILYVSTTSNGERYLYDPDLKEVLDSPVGVTEALNILSYNAFPDKDSRLDVIRINEDRIAFCIENGQYAVVYSPNGKPTYVNADSETNGVIVRAIGDGWYHVTKDPDT